MYIDLILLIVLMVVVIMFFKRFSSFVFFIAIFGILLLSNNRDFINDKLGENSFLSDQISRTSGYLYPRES